MAVRASLSRFESYLEFPEADAEFDTGVAQVSVGADLELLPSWATRWKSGVTANRAEYENGLRGGGSSFLDQEGSGVEVAGYSQVHWDPSPNWLMEGGVRADHWRPNAGETEAILSPRFAVQALSSGEECGGAPGSGPLQPVHPLDARRGVPLRDRYLGADGRRGSARGVRPGAGGDRELLRRGRCLVRLARRLLSHLRRRRNAVNAADNPNDETDALVAGEGDAYGVDLYIRRDRGNTTGWVSVSFLKTLRSFPDTRSGMEPSPLITYPPVFDRRFEVDLALRRPLGWWGLELGVRANFGTGLPFTRPRGIYHVYRTHLVGGGASFEDEPAVLLGPRNGSRFPARHRLDLSFRKTVTKSWGTMTPYLSVINVYNKKNVLFYFYDYGATPPTPKRRLDDPPASHAGPRGVVPMKAGRHLARGMLPRLPPVRRVCRRNRRPGRPPPPRRLRAHRGDARGIGRRGRRRNPADPAPRRR